LRPFTATYVRDCELHLTVFRSDLALAIKNRHTLLREAEERLKRTHDPMEIVDMLHILDGLGDAFLFAGEDGQERPAPISPRSKSIARPAW
jgi:hypothetical protein